MTRSATQPAADDRSGPPEARGTRAATFTGSSHNPAERTVEAVLSVGARVRRWFGWEELAMTAEAIDLTRVGLGQVRLLDTHNAYQIDAVLGTVENVRLEGDQLLGTLRFADTDRGRQAEGMVSRGELTGVSIGYGVSNWRMVEIDDAGNEIWQAARWELTEVSLVSVPADPNAGVRSAVPVPGAEEEDPDMTRSLPAGDTPAAPAAAPASAQQTQNEQRAAPAAAPAPAISVIDASAARMDGPQALQFAEDARALGVTDTQIRTWAETMTPDAARAALVRHAADAQRAASPLAPAMSSPQITRDERDTMRTAIESALMNRFNPANELHEAGREYRGMSLLEIGRRNLERNGERVSGLNRRELAERILSRQLTTSDFPHVLGNVVHRTLRGGYEAAPRTFARWMRRATVPDFRQVSRLQIGGAPAFLHVPEGGEFKMGKIGDAKEVYALATYGRRIPISRQVIINDDLDALTRIPAMIGRAAADFESDAAYAPLIANPNMGDGKALFHADHGNLAGAGAAISETSVQEGETAMGTQKGLDGRYINVQPAFLITATKDKVAGQKLLTAIQATATSGVNVYAGSMEPVVEPRLSRASGATPWFMAADPAQVDTIEYAYLEGDEGVYVEERAGFEVDGIEFKGRLDFAVKAIDWRGLWMNPGQ